MLAREAVQPRAEGSAAHAVSVSRVTVYKKMKKYRLMKIASPA